MRTGNHESVNRQKKSDIQAKPFHLHGWKIALVATIIVILSMVGFFLWKQHGNQIALSLNPDHMFNPKEDNSKPEKQIVVPEESKDIFAGYYQKAEEIVKQMTMEEKIGQMMLVRCPEEGAIEQITKLQPAGYILFGRDFKNKTKAGLKTEIESYQNSSKIPMLIAVDEEGGSVVRMSAYTTFRSSKFPSPQQLYRDGGIENVKRIETEKIELLQSVGINLNLAPLADVSTSPTDYIYARTLGKDATTTASYIQEMIVLGNQKKMGMTLKHFPGYGSNPDTHTEVVIDKRPESTFRESDFLPFIAGIKHNAQSILVSHNILSWKDATKPSSLSKPVHELLRNELGFTGVIMTDDLIMEGITKYANGADAAVLAVNAGNDLLISSDFQNDKEAILNALREDKIAIDTVNLAVKRVIAWKYYLGFMQ